MTSLQTQSKVRALHMSDAIETVARRAGPGAALASHRPTEHKSRRGRRGSSHLGRTSGGAERVSKPLSEEKMFDPQGSATESNLQHEVAARAKIVRQRVKDRQSFDLLAEDDPSAPSPQTVLAQKLLTALRPTAEEFIAGGRLSKNGGAFIAECQLKKSNLPLRQILSLAQTMANRSALDCSHCICIKDEVERVAAFFAFCGCLALATKAEAANSYEAWDRLKFIVDYGGEVRRDHVGRAMSRLTRDLRALVTRDTEALPIPVNTLLRSEWYSYRPAPQHCQGSLFQPGDDILMQHRQWLGDRDKGVICMFLHSGTKGSTEEYRGTPPDLVVGTVVSSTSTHWRVRTEFPRPLVWRLPKDNWSSSSRVVGYRRDGVCLRLN